MTAFVIDRYYLVITLLITLAWQIGGFFIAWTLQVCEERYYGLNQELMIDDALSAFLLVIIPLLIEKMVFHCFITLK